MKIWITSDTHFNHDKIIEYCNRPSDHEIVLLGGLSSLPKDDCLIHLGDICIGNDLIVHSLLENVKCRKILVCGNHDNKSWSWYMSHGWDFLCDAIRIKYCGKILMFSHIPQPWDGVWDINVHGHLHNLGRLKEIKHEMRKWHRLYSPEHFNYMPIELTKFIMSSLLDEKGNTCKDQ